MPFLIFNATDGLYAHPDPFATREEAERFATEIRQRFDRHGYYASCEGRIPVSELKLTTEEYMEMEAGARPTPRLWR